MQNQPLNSNDRGKLLTFALIFTPSVVLLFGAIPGIFLAFGFNMMKKSQDFSYIDTAVKYFKGYFCLVMVVCLLGSFYEDPKVWLAWAAGLFVYFMAVSILFYRPLKEHSEWVTINGIFSTKPKSDSKPNINSGMAIIKGEKLKQYSVADELCKWAKLKEDGHISEEEFNQARDKLLNRN